MSIIINISKSQKKIIPSIIQTEISKSFSSHPLLNHPPILFIKYHQSLSMACLATVFNSLASALGKYNQPRIIYARTVNNPLTYIIINLTSLTELIEESKHENI
jgi:hypothetical protein